MDCFITSCLEKTKSCTCKSDDSQGAQLNLWILWLWKLSIWPYRQVYNQVRTFCGGMASSVSTKLWTLLTGNEREHSSQCISGSSSKGRDSFGCGVCACPVSVNVIASLSATSGCKNTGMQPKSVADTYRPPDPPHVPNGTMQNVHWLMPSCVHSSMLFYCVKLPINPPRQHVS